MFSFMFVLFVMGVIYVLLTRNNDDANYVFYIVLPITLICGVITFTFITNITDERESRREEQEKRRAEEILQTKNPDFVIHKGVLNIINSPQSEHLTMLNDLILHVNDLPEYKDNVSIESMILNLLTDGYGFEHLLRGFENERLQLIATLLEYNMPNLQKDDYEYNYLTAKNTSGASPHIYTKCRVFPLYRALIAQDGKVKWLLKHHRDLINSECLAHSDSGNLDIIEYLINDGVPAHVFKLATIMSNYQLRWKRYPDIKKQNMAKRLMYLVDNGVNTHMSRESYINYMSTYGESLGKINAEACSTTGKAAVIEGPFERSGQPDNFKYVLRSKNNPTIWLNKKKEMEAIKYMAEEFREKNKYKDYELIGGPRRYEGPTSTKYYDRQEFCPQVFSAKKPGYKTFWVQY